MTDDKNPNDRYEVIKTYSNRQKELVTKSVLLDEPPCDPMMEPEEETKVLRQMTPAEQWHMFDMLNDQDARIIEFEKLNQKLKSIMEDMFEHDMVFGWTLK